MQPVWNKTKLAKVDAKPVGFWNLVIDYFPGSHLLRLQVVSKDEKDHDVPILWSPIHGMDCAADGSTIPKSGLLYNGAMYGALIAKIGGSSADLPDSSSTGGPYGSKKVFAVGSCCVVAIGDTEGGPLFLTMNDSFDGFPHHSGALHILIEHCQV